MDPFKIVRTRTLFRWWILIVSGFLICSHQFVMAIVQDTIFQDTLQFHNASGVTAAWDSLDRARQLHLAGESDQALAILENIGSDSTTTDPHFRAAHRELLAFILYSAGEYQRAFDTLQVFSQQAAERHRTDLEIEQQRSKVNADSLNTSIEVLHQQIESTRVEAQEDRDRSLWIGAGVIGLLIIIIVLLVFRPDRKAPEVQAGTPRTEVQATKLASPIEAATPATRSKEDKNDPNLIHAHLMLVSDRLNKGETVEAAAHIGVLARYVKLLDDQPAGLVLVQQAIPLLRQYLKLASLRFTEKLRYSIEADRAIMDSDVTVPVHRICSLFSVLLDRLIGHEEPSLASMLVLQPSSGRPVMLIELPLNNAMDLPKIEGLQIAQRNRQGTIELEASWQAIQPA